MTVLFLLGFLGALFVDLKSQIDRLRKGLKLSLFRYGRVGNTLFAVYYCISGILAVLVAIAGVESIPDAFSWPTAMFALKTFYLGFAVSTNIAFLSKIIDIKRAISDDTKSKSPYLTKMQLIARELDRFRYDLSNKF